MAGAEILIYPTAIGWDPSDSPAEQQRQLEAWQLIQRAHAVANGLPVVVANRSGFEASPADNGADKGAESGIQFWGHSFIAGPQGELLAQAATQPVGSEQPADVFCATIDRQRSETVRRIWPFFRDRRIDAYQGLTSRWLD